MTSEPNYLSGSSATEHPVGPGVVSEQTQVEPRETKRPARDVSLDNKLETVHAGHDLETGLFARAREWVDLFPWLRLGRAARVAGSPPLLALVAIAFALWFPVATRLASPKETPAGPAPSPGAELPRAAGGSTESAVWTTSRLLRRSLPVAWFEPVSATTTWPRRAGLMIWSLVIWIPAALVLVRQGALLCGGRDMQPLGELIRQSLSRAPAAAAAAVVPLGCVLALSIFAAAAGWWERSVGFGWFHFPVALLLLLGAIPIGMLAFGGHLAIPLAWCAIANEAEADPLDALSRGYEYLFRRPLKLALYAVISSVPLAVIGAVSWGIARSAAAVQVAVIGTGEGGLASTIGDWLSYFPLVVALTLFWGLIGGVYLMVRQDAGGQEPEDLWQPPHTPKPPLPVRSPDGNGQP